MLYQRVKRVAQELAGSDVKMGTSLGMNPRTFSGYLQAAREHNLWPLLPKMLEVYPQISREWLYFNEGEMYVGKEDERRTIATPLQAVTNRSAPADRVSVIDGECKRILELEEQLSSAHERERKLQQELLRAKDKIIALYEQGGTQKTPFLPNQDTPVPIIDGAVPSLRHDNERSKKR